MGAEVNAFIGAQIGEPDVLLSETLYPRISPELKQELTQYAADRNMKLGDMLIEAFGLFARARGAGMETVQLGRAKMRHAAGGRDG